MSSDAIEGELSSLEANPIFSPSMPTLDVLSESISQPILDPDNLSYALSPKSHDNNRNPLRQQSIGVMKTTRMTKKSNDNGRNILRIAWNI
jgi:hypothetical protein